MAVRPAHGEGANEMGVAACLVTLGEQFLLDPLHRDHEILALAGPAGGVNTGAPVERIDPEAAVVGAGWEAREVRRPPRLPIRLVDEGGPGFVGLVTVKVGGRELLSPGGTAQVGVV